MITYKYEELFHDDPETGEIILTIPQEILDEKGWTEGTKLKIEIGDQGSLILTERSKGSR